jgi:hypothetical protein
VWARCTEDATDPGTGERILDSNVAAALDPTECLGDIINAVGILECKRRPGLQIPGSYLSTCMNVYTSWRGIAGSERRLEADCQTTSGAWKHSAYWVLAGGEASNVNGMLVSNYGFPDMFSLCADYSFDGKFLKATCTAPDGSRVHTQLDYPRCSSSSDGLLWLTSDGRLRCGLRSCKKSWFGSWSCGDNNT